MKSLIVAIRKIVSSFTQGSGKPGCVTEQKSSPEADLARIRDCVISVEDPAISLQRVTLRYAGEGRTSSGALCHFFRLGNKIEMVMGIAPDVKNPKYPWIHSAKGFSFSASLFVNDKRIPIKHEWRTTKTVYPPRVRRPSIA